MKSKISNFFVTVFFFTVLLLPSVASMAAGGITVSPTRLTWAWDDTSAKMIKITAPANTRWLFSYEDDSYQVYPLAGVGTSRIRIKPSSPNTSLTANEVFLELSVGSFDFMVQLVQEGCPSSPEPGGDDPEEEDTFVIPASGTNFICTTTFVSSDGNESFSDVTYYDGLGYAVQENRIGAGGSGRSLIRPVVYDSMRRPDVKSYLPYASSGDSGMFIPTGSAISSQESFYRDTFGDNHAYSMNEYEQWSGGLLTGSRREGDAWASSDRRASVDRRGVTQSEGIMRLSLSGDVVTCTGTYGDGSLICIETSDEEGSVTKTYCDGRGRTLCVRQNDGSVNADTYYVHDIRDSLVCVIQPEGAHLLESRDDRSITLSPSVHANADIYEGHCFSWKYDAWGNVTEYHVPGGGTTFYTYDERNRLVSEMTPKLAEQGATREMSYDDCNRPLYERYRRAGGGSVVTRSWTYYPFGESAPAGSRGRLMSETVREIPLTVDVRPADVLLVTRSYTYDTEGRVTGIAESWSDGWTSNVSTAYDFLGHVLSVTEAHQSPEGCSQTISTSYTYDLRGRKLTCSRTLSEDGTSETALATVSYSYDELGRPSGKSVTGPEGSLLMETDLDLDLHGWTTGITSKDGHGSPFFSEHLAYADPSRGISTARFDGNISETTSIHNTANANSSSLAIHSYSYDGMKRLTDAVHTGPDPSFAESNRNTERDISYDRNGNILALTRYGGDGSAETLSFTHDGNRLASVNGSPFTYDCAGNMTSDGRKGLDISYNCLNLPSYAETADGSSLTYTYLADGTKVSAVSGCGYGLKYRGSFVYETGDSMDDCLQSIAWDEGRIMLVAPAVDTLVAIEPELPEIDMPGEEVADSALVDIAAGMLRDLFFVTDHLGNVRSVVDVSPDLTEPVILEQDDYLPFGTRVQNPSFAGVDDNRYRYAGKEEQRIGGSDISLLDFGARYYDPYIARWTSVDPMASDFSSISPFNYCGGNPIINQDIDGRIWDTAWDIANVVMDVKSLVSNIKQGNTKDVIIDGAGLVVDVAAAALPFVPGGAGAGIKAVRTGEKVADAINSVDNVVDVSKTVDKATGAKKTLQESSKIGQEAHRQIEKEIVSSNPGSKAEATITINKKNYRKDVKLQDDTYVIIKPDTPSGHVSGEKRKQLLESDNKRSIIHYYDPNDSRWLPSSPTYIGPKKK